MQIVRYQPRYLGKRRRVARRLSHAYNVYKGRRSVTATDVRRAARLIQKGYRAYKRTKSNRIVGTPLSGVRHRQEMVGSKSTFQSLERKTLDLNEMKFNLPPNTNDTLGSAPGMTYSLAGFRMCMTFRNDGTLPIEVHWAICQLKDTGDSIVGTKDEWFSDPGGSSIRYRGFEDYTTDPTYDNRILCQGINTRNLNVLTHQKFVLMGNQNQSGTGPNAQYGATWKKIDRYWNMKGKKFAYLSTTSTGVERPMFLAVWHDRVDAPFNSSLPINYNVQLYGYTRRSNK